MISSLSRAAIIVGFFVLTAIEAGSSAYERARDLADDDPLEAEALYAAFIADSGSDKLKRAAAHELFALRLKGGRLTEAFFQARSASFRKRLQSAVEEGLKISDVAARRLISALRRECSADGDAGEITEILAKEKYPIAAYNFSVRILARCKVENPQKIFPEFPEDKESDNRSIHLALLEIREAVSRDDFEEAESLLGQVRKAGAKNLAKEPALQMQIDFTAARLLAMKEDFSALKVRCAEIESKKPPKRTRNACRYLIAYALMKEEKYPEAYAKISTLKVESGEIDNRLLRLTAAVASGEEPPEKLEKFTRRRSYKECAPILRDLAETILEKNK